MLGMSPFGICLGCAAPAGGDDQSRAYPHPQSAGRRCLGVPLPAKVSRHLQLRLETQPNIIQDISWKAHVRLGQRSRRLVARGKHATVVTVAWPVRW
jgi:hypothetical protein